MNNLKHVGIYVHDLEKETFFYKNVFSMTPICENRVQRDELIDDIFLGRVQEVIFSKLITPQGQISGYGDMIELLQVVGIGEKSHSDNIFDIGCVHIGLGVENIESIVRNIVSLGGTQITDIHMLNNNKCCMCRDPEGNYLELIENM